MIMSLSMPNTDHSIPSQSIHVAVGVITRVDGSILIALRKKDQHQGGLWEFPGGKVEAGEDAQQALVRELHEELGIHALSFEPLIKISHRYPDKSVVLDVWVVTQFSGEAIGKEGQTIRWVNPISLIQYQFPAANIPIVKAILLPSYVAVTGSYDDEQDCMFRVNRAIDRGVGLIQLRLIDRSLPFTVDHINAIKGVCKMRGVKLVVNSAIEFNDYSVDIGLHLTSANLLALEERPVSESVLLGASCHNIEELEHAKKINVDYVFLSPVQKTMSHGDTIPLGWNEFARLVEVAGFPVYALGGLAKEDIKRARKLGAQGVAAISSLWD